MREFEEYLKQRRKILIRKGIPIPELVDVSEDGLFRFSKMLEEVYNLIDFDDFYGKMHEKFYKEFVEERDKKAREIPLYPESEEIMEEVIEDLEPDTSDESTKEEGMNDFLSMLESVSKVSEGVEDPDAPKEWGTDDEEEDLDAPQFSGFEDDEEEDLDAPSYSGFDDDDEDLDAPPEWGNEDDEDLDAPSSWGFDNEEEDLDVPIEWGTNEKVFDIPDKLIEEVKEEPPKVDLPESVLRSNQTVDLIGSLFGGSKKKKRRKQ